MNKVLLIFVILLFLSGCCCCPIHTSNFNKISSITPVAIKKATIAPIITNTPTVKPVITKNNQKEEEYYNQGNKFITEGKNLEAIVSYNKALKINPDNAYVHWGKGNAYKGLGNYKQALICYEMALILDPENKDILSCKKEVEKLIENETISIRVEDLIREYEENTVAADMKYKGKLLEVTGIATQISGSFNSLYVILAPDEDNISGVQCMFPIEKKELLAKFKKGQCLCAKGRCKGKFLLNIVLENE